MESKQTKNKVTPQFRLLFILIDGIGDNGIQELGMKTPLQYAELPHFDALAAGGLNGMHDPVQSGLACGSDTAHMSIFGYDPFKFYNGRGSFESMGSGIPMGFDDIAFKSNFAYINDSTGIVERRRVDRHFDKWGLDICKDLNGVAIPGYEKDYKVVVVHATEHRCGIKVTGPGLSSDITGTDPIVDNKPLRKVEALDKANPAAVRTADIINKLSEAIRARLRVHPANLARQKAGLPFTNVVLLRGCGSRLHVDSLESRQHMKGFMVAPTAVIAGIGVTFGIDIKIAKGATGYYDSDYSSKAAVAIENLTNGKYDFGFLHIKGVDDSGHDGNAKIKVELLKRIDEMIEKLIAELRSDEEKSGHKVKYAILVTGDHTTPIRNKEHSYEPVPVMISTVTGAYFALQKKAAGILPESLVDKALCTMNDGLGKYSEVDACKGSLGRFQGSEMMGLIRRFKEACGKCVEDVQTAAGKQ